MNQERIKNISNILAKVDPNNLIEPGAIDDKYNPETKIIDKYFDKEGFKDLDKTAKEISLVTNFLVMGNYPNDYTDLLRVSPQWISYKRVNDCTNETLFEWSYKTKSKEYFIKWKHLIKTFCQEVACPSKKVDDEDTTSFNIRITFKDNTHIDIGGTSDFYSNNLKDQADAFMNLIPKGEQCPDLIKPFIATYLCKKNLMKKEIDKLNLKSVNSIMYAEGGALGFPGLLEITTDDYCLYSNRKKSNISQDEVLLLFPDLQFFSPTIRPAFFNMNDEKWFYIDLGFGNHLYLRKDLYEKVGSQILDSKVSQRYINWLKVFHNDYE